MKLFTLLLLLLPLSLFASVGEPMILEFNTNLSTGTKVELPLGTTGDIANVLIEWGDGTSQTVTSAETVEHTYSANGVYTAKISGSLSHFGNNQGADENRKSLTKVISWGDLGTTDLTLAFMVARNLTSLPATIPASVTNMSNMFAGAASFQGDISGWDVSNVTDMSWMFSNAPLFNSDISGWNVSSVTDMNTMFRQASSFNRDISGWDVSNVTNMGTMFINATSFDRDLSGWDVRNVMFMNMMFYGTGLSTANYDALLNGWSTQPLQRNIQFGADICTYSSEGSEARQKIIDNFGWTITDGGAPMILEFNTNLSTGKTIELPLGMADDDITDVVIDWGDGSSQAVTSPGTIEHTYSANGVYTAKISGTLSHFGNNLGADENHKSLTKVISWGDLGTTDLTLAFMVARNLTSVPTTVPKTVTKMSSMFVGADSFTGDLSGWDVSNVTDMSWMFYNMARFTSDLSGWDVSSVTDMNNMFGSNALFNSDISGWDVSNVTNMGTMFMHATSFDHDLSSWDVSKVTSMHMMFYGTGLSTANYDALLTGWGKQQLQSNVVFDGGNSTYHAGRSARQSLIDNFGWTISDSGFVNSTPVITSKAVPVATENVLWSYSAATSDEDGDAIRYSFTHTTAGMSANGNVISWTPSEGVTTSGEILLTVFDQYGGSATEKFTIAVTGIDNVPVVNIPLEPVTVNEGAADKTIDLSTLFTDIDNVDAAITMAVMANSKEALLTATIVGDVLTLDFLDNQHGDATVTIMGISNGKTVLSALSVEVIAIPDITTRKRDSTKTTTVRDTIVKSVYHGEIGKEDTIVTTTVLDTVTDSTWGITETLSGGFVTSSAAVFGIDTLWVEIISNISDTMKFDPGTAITSTGSLETSFTGIAFTDNPVSAENGTVEILVGTAWAVSIRMVIFDNLGNVIDEQESATSVSGAHSFGWDLRNNGGELVGSGAYRVVAEVEMRDGSRKMLSALLGVKR